jgi:hypothetical protein
MNYYFNMTIVNLNIIASIIFILFVMIILLFITIARESKVQHETALNTQDIVFSDLPQGKTQYNEQS